MKKFDQIVDEASEYLQTAIDTSTDSFKLGSYERFDFDQAKGVFIWSDAGIPQVYATPLLVGSISNTSNTWLWSWANPSILPNVKDKIETVREFGETHGLEELTTAKWEASEVDGWEMTAISAKLLGAVGAYRAPTGNGYAFFVFTEISWA